MPNKMGLAKRVVNGLNTLSFQLLRPLFYLWVLLLPVQIDTTEALGFRLAPGDVALAVMAALLLATKGPCAILRALRKRSPLILALALAFWFCLTLPVSVHALGGISSYVLINKIIGLACLILILATFSFFIESTEHVAWATKWYVRLGSVWNVLGFIALVLYIVGQIRTPFVSDSGRLAGLLVDPNAYGGFLVTVFLLQLRLVDSVWEPWGKRVWIWNSLLLLVSIVFTSSRSAALALLIATLFSWFEYRDRNRRITRLLLSAALVAVILIWSQPFWRLGRGTVFPEEHARANVRIQNLSVRLSTNIVALKAFAHSPIWGIGLGVFPTLEGSEGLIIHNTFLWLLTETGLVGLLIFGFFIVAVGLAYRRAKVLQSCIASGLAAAIVAWLGLMLGIEALYQRHFWFLCALIVSLGSLNGVREQFANRIPGEA